MKLPQLEILIPVAMACTILGTIGLLSVAYAADSEWCYDKVSSDSTALTFCGVGTGTEVQARSEALSSARATFQALAQDSDSIRNSNVSVEPGRLDCEAIGNTVTCYRLVTYHLTPASPEQKEAKADVDSHRWIEEMKASNAAASKRNQEIDAARYAQQDKDRIESEARNRKDDVDFAAQQAKDDQAMVQWQQSSAAAVRQMSPEQRQNYANSLVSMADHVQAITNPMPTVVVQYPAGTWVPMVQK